MAGKTFQRTLVVGDIHGSHAALSQVLERCKFDCEQDRLISLGDLVDYHEDSDKVLDTLLTIPNLVAVRGNHDIWAEEWLRTGERDAVWLHNGGEATIEAFERRSEAVQDRYRSFFFRQVPYFLDGKNRLFVHADVDLAVPLDAQRSETLFWGRKLWTLAATLGQQGLTVPGNPFGEIFLGHTPTHRHWPEALPVHFGTIWNLDQGIKRGGKLTIMDVDTKEFWQSDALEPPM